MTRNELLRRFPNASENFIAANLALGGAPSSAKPKSIVRHESLGAAPRKEAHRQRFSVRITSYRRRLADPDNLCGKFFVDQCRYLGLIPDDTAAVLDYSIRQEKVSRFIDERTEIEITLL